MAGLPNANTVHVLVMPFPGFGHLLPHMDLANQLALRGLKITILVTPKNLPYLNPLLSLHPDSIQTLVLPFPPQPSLPLGVESMHEVPALESFPIIASALSQLYDSICQWIKNHPSPPVAIIPDIYLSSWTRRLAADFGIKLIGYSAVNANSILLFCARQEMHEFFEREYLEARGSWGLIFNSFVEFESERLEEVKRDFLGHDRVWAVGPLLPMKSGSLERGGPSSVPVGDVLDWLDLCSQDQADRSSVVFVGFGSQITLSTKQKEAVARALEDSQVRFIWAVKDPMKTLAGQDGSDEDHESVVPAGFEDRVAGRGLVIRGWAPQVKILNHPAVGSYLTHCGWNSVLEGLLGGVLLLAWPMQIDHYYNADMLVDKFGAAVRVCEGMETVPDSEKLARILRESVKGDLSERIQAIELRRKALDAIAKGGTSHDALDELVKEISKLQFKAGNQEENETGQ